MIQCAFVLQFSKNFHFISPVQNPEREVVIIFLFFIFKRIKKQTTKLELQVLRFTDSVLYNEYRARVCNAVRIVTFVRSLQWTENPPGIKKRRKENKKFGACFILLCRTCQVFK